MMYICWQTRKLSITLVPSKTKNSIGFWIIEYWIFIYLSVLVSYQPPKTTKILQPLTY